MFKLGKNKSDRQERTASATTEKMSDLEANIHVMPKKFYVTSKKSNKGMWVIIVIGVLIIGVLVATAIFLNFSLGQKQSVNQNTNLNVNQPINTDSGNTNFNANTNINSNINTNTNVNISTSTPDLPTTTDPGVNVNTNINTNTNTGTDEEVNDSIEVTPLPSAPDSDGDGLTLEEENLFGTDPTLIDSDGDGFDDGSEILNGYDPSRPNQTLIASGVFTPFANSDYSINHPAGWQLRQQNSNTETLFISNTGEFIEVVVIENPNQLPLAEWYAQQYPQIDITKATSLRLTNFSGYRHPDNRIYFLTRNGNNNKVIMINYNVGNFNLTNFATTFNAMVKSLQ